MEAEERRRRAAPPSARRVRPATLLLVLIALAGCGGRDAADVVAETAANLAEINSGTVSLRLFVDPEGGHAGELAFLLEGPFAISAGGHLEAARLTYTEVEEGRRHSRTFVVRGGRAFVEIRGSTEELSRDDAERLRSMPAVLELHALRLGDWLRGGKLSDGGLTGGVETDRVRGELDARAAADQLLDVARRVGLGDLEQVGGMSPRQLAEAARAASFDLHTGKEDRLLHRLKLDLLLGFELPDALERALGTVVGAKVTFELAIREPNEPVIVPPPENPRPHSEIRPVMPETR